MQEVIDSLSFDETFPFGRNLTCFSRKFNPSINNLIYFYWKAADRIDLYWLKFFSNIWTLECSTKVGINDASFMHSKLGVERDKLEH